jgi:Mrp family chromosome partitioning ATPase
MATDRTIVVSVRGGTPSLEQDVAGTLGAADGIEVSRSSSLLADVVVVAGDSDLSALDRCREAASSAPVVVVLDGAPTVSAVTAAMGAGARATVGLPLDAFDLVDAIRSAAAFTTAPDPHARRGQVVVVSGSAGGVGASVVAYLLARATGPTTALVDLDLCGGEIAGLAGVTPLRDSAGLAGETSGRRAWQRLAVEVSWGTVLALPRRPDLAWIVRDGVAGELVRAAAERHATVIVDVGRATGPALEVIREADAALVICRAGRAQLAVAVEHAALLARLGAERFVPRIVVNGAGPVAWLATEVGRSAWPGVAVVVPRLRRRALIAPRARGTLARRLLTSVGAVR